MAVGLYSGVSGLAVGVGLYKGVSGLWGGSSGLINGFGGGFSPAELFTTGEPGAWYDPSDLTTLFRDSAGTTPVTAAAQQVGLALDKSQGAPATGPELVTNGSFTGNATGWTLNAAATYNNNAVDITALPSTTVALSQTLATPVIGRAYVVAYTVSNYSGTGSLRFSFGGVNGTFRNTNGTFTEIISVASLSGVLNFQNGGNPYTGTIDNISVKLLPGNHAFQSNLAQRPTLGREPYTGVRNLLTFTEQFDNAVWSKSGTTTPNAFTVVENNISSVKFCRQINFATLVNGVSYAFSFKAKRGAGSRNININFGNAPINNTGVTIDLLSGAVIAAASGISANVSPADADGYFLVTGTYTGNGTLAIYRFDLVTNTYTGTAGEVYLGDGVSSVLIKDAQLETGSTATAYQKVVSSFDVTEAGVPDVWYLSFDGTDDGMLTNTITPGIDKAQVFAGVRKLGVMGSSGTLVELSADANSNNGTFIIGAPGGVTQYFATSRGTSSVAVNTANASFAAPITNTLTLIGDIAGDTALLRINAAQVASSTADQGTGNYLAYPLYIGRRAGATLPYNGRIYSLILRFGANLSATTISQTEVWVAGKTGFFAPIITGVPTIGVS